MATHSSTLAWKIPWMEEPGRLQSLRLWRVGHNWATSLSLFTFMHWRRKWQPTPVFLPGESWGQRRLVGCRLWGHTRTWLKWLSSSSSSSSIWYWSSVDTQNHIWSQSPCLKADRLPQAYRQHYSLLQRPCLRDQFSNLLLFRSSNL